VTTFKDNLGQGVGHVQPATVDAAPRAIRWRQTPASAHGLVLRNPIFPIALVSPVVPCLVVLPGYESGRLAQLMSSKRLRRPYTQQEACPGAWAQPALAPAGSLSRHEPPGNCREH
jgi:hypothetical protein